MLTPSFSKKWPFWENIRNTQTLNDYAESCVGFKPISLTISKSLGCIFNDKIEFWTWFPTSEFLIFWTFLFSSQNSVLLIFFYSPILLHYIHHSINQSFHPSIFPPPICTFLLLYSHPPSLISSTFTPNILLFSNPPSSYPCFLLVSLTSFFLHPPSSLEPSFSPSCSFGLPFVPLLDPSYPPCLIHLSFIYIINLT